MHSSQLSATRHSLGELSDLCRREIQRFHSNESFDDSFCFELFRRAIQERSSDCWRELQVLYQDQVIAWCRRAGSTPGLNAEDLAAVAWEKFWLSFGPNQLSQASGTASIQRYLKACVYSVVIDIAREQKATVSLDRPISPGFDESLTIGDCLIDSRSTPEDRLIEAERQHSLRQVVDCHAQKEDERAILYLKYELGLSAADVQERRPDLFMTVSDVYRVTRNLLDRLRRSPDMQRWFNEQN